MADNDEPSQPTGFEIVFTASGVVGVGTAQDEPEDES